MASSVIFHKAVLKSTTKMSLNERFTQMLTSKPPVLVTVQTTSESQPEQEQNPKVGQELKQQDQVLQSAGSGSQSFLAQQMENRPSVREALTPKAHSFTVKNYNVKQRLGKSSVHSRLGWPAGSLAKRALGGWEGSSYEAPEQKRGKEESKSQMIGKQSEEHQQKQSSSPQTRVRRDFRRGSGWGGSASHGGYNGCGSYSVGGGRRRRHHHRRRYASSQPLPTKEQLDNQLDDYMAKSREQLDAELDAYLASPKPFYRR